MLIKSCVLGYYMIPQQQHTLMATKLTLGARIDKGTHTACILSPAASTDEIVTVKEQYDYYNDWLQSIKGLPY